VDIRYLAGFFDGEGCVLFHYLKASQIIRPEAEVSQTRLPILKEFKKRFGGTIVGPMQNNERAKPHWRWIVLSKVCINFLEQMQKHVTIKQPQINLMLRYDKWKREKKNMYTYNVNGCGKKRTPETMIALKKWRSKMQLLNKRGV
jgi:hypothetical protein